jgi:hypothetical protein
MNSRSNNPLAELAYRLLSGVALMVRRLLAVPPRPGRALIPIPIRVETRSQRRLPSRHRP